MEQVPLPIVDDWFQAPRWLDCALDDLSAFPISPRDAVFLLGGVEQRGDGLGHVCVDLTNVSEPTLREEIEENTVFLNVDLDLFADFDLKPLAAALAPLDCLHVADAPPYEAHLEGSCSVPSASVAIERILETIDALSPTDLDLFARCTARKLDIGIQSGLQPYSWCQSIAPALLRRMANLNIELALTVYGTRTRHQDVVTSPVTVPVPPSLP